MHCIITKRIKKLTLGRSCYFLAVLIFFALFVNQSYDAFRKFTMGNTGHHTDVRVIVNRYLKHRKPFKCVFKEKVTGMYPSISVCKKWAFDLATLDFEGYSNETVSTFIGWLNEYSVRMEDQFYFFTLPGLKNLTFPCTTTLGGMTPGRPCAFPIYWFGKFKDKCFYMGTQSPACLTKRPTGGNISDYFDHSQDYFGYCQANCSGEMPGPNSPYNLASSKHKQYWYSFFYDLSSYENGYCHTFNPPQKSVPGMENRMYFMINNISAYSTSYDVFLHERGQFWPRSDMFSLGQSEPVKVELHSDVVIIFTHQKIARLHSQSRPCIESLDYSFTKCIQNFAVRKTTAALTMVKTNKSCAPKKTFSDILNF